MAEYIERNAILDKLYAEDAITMRGVEILNQFPAADVAPVVRCKDCKYYEHPEYCGYDGGGTKDVCRTFKSQMQEQTGILDNDIFKVVQSYNILVDKKELIRALKYDRDQYNKGTLDGVAAFMEMYTNSLYRLESLRYTEHPQYIAELKRVPRDSPITAFGDGFEYAIHLVHLELAAALEMLPQRKEERND